MTSQENKYEKHSQLKKPVLGNYGRKEIALIGAPCNELRHLASALAGAFPASFKLAWLDAYHPEEEAGNELHLHVEKEGLTMVRVREDYPVFGLRQLLEPYDLVLLNGNHFKGQSQIIILDPGKKDSLERKTDRLTDPICILKTAEQARVYDFLEEKLDRIQSLPRIDSNDLTGIASTILDWMEKNKPGISGLVLVGGRSERMGRDKSRICYHGMEQYAWLTDTLEELIDEVFISCRQDQAAYYEGLGYKTITDTYAGLGPFGAILSAFRLYPDRAWLVTACDLPLLTKEAFESLIQSRNANKVATAFYNPATAFPDPLITLWEPVSYSQLLWFLSRGFSCPRKVLINTDIEVIKAKDPDWLKNVNTQADLTSLDI